MEAAGAGKAAAGAGKAAAVCVTGAGGFIASWLVRRLLSRGDYAVHGTVRDPSDPKNDHLRALAGAGERLRLFKADVLDYLSVASAVAGCAGVFHIASPCPAAKSTNPEQNWYCLSKTLAEREALSYAEKTGLSVVTVCPSLVFGPLLQPTVNASSLFLINYLKCEGADAMEDKVRNMVDVRDVADALVLAYESPEAAGRYICSAHARKVSETVSIVRSMYPNLNYPKKYVQVGDQKVFSSEKLRRLGWKFTTLEEMLKDSVESYMAAGILN
ncbi:unnamed protein product [Triticum turgidum subsp. durum]|uniref:NAD-dependent epimerase/dehydratase domain-containing protein n=1 Tax=Triticum turgidum subsp. durum TaxID=4567 RepID=A0A9R1BSK0_TRITD|nr:unnamed protein product [Triticum turgidum subsp. durum]